MTSLHGPISVSILESRTCPSLITIAAEISIPIRKAGCTARQGSLNPVIVEGLGAVIVHERLIECGKRRAFVKKELCWLSKKLDIVVVSRCERVVTISKCHGKCGVFQ